ncbi:uncharacterized protein LOC108159544 isoform X10 [Drosophila miranda]|uniref:uncharacterized protein LOC108159544 isoform X10 n=1 Tax=Drosophila miranda TaxID=7229 RepID=UPI00143F6BC6|nr:uncharacterized protein LOC108159544 isoform X10 [Drosophila miranda]
MPNNRNRNRNRNRNKRNRNQNQNQNQNQQQQEQREEEQQQDPQPEAEASSSSIADNGNSGSVSNELDTGTATNKVAVDPQLGEWEEPPKAAAAAAVEEEEKESTNHVAKDETEEKEPSTSSNQTEMGSKNSKHQTDKSGKQSSNESEKHKKELEQQEVPPLKAPGSPRQAKVIVHRIVREADETDGAEQPKGESPIQDQSQDQQQSNTSQDLKEDVAQRNEEVPVPHVAPHPQGPPLQRSTKVIIHQIRLERDDHAADQERKGKPTFEEISTTSPAPPGSLSLSQGPGSGTLSPPPRYLVESPKNVSGAVGQFTHFARDVQIQELELTSDCSSGEFNVLASPLVCEADSETEAAPATPTSTSPPDLQPSSRAEQQEQLRQKRAQKRNALETHFLPQLMHPRYLDSILEENSDLAGVGHPGLNRSSSSGNDLAGMRVPKVTETFPKSQLDFSRRHKRREEPVALMLETKLIEEASDLESCTRLQSALSPQSEDAELVYLSSSASSSMSDLMELELEQAAALAERALVDLDTDASKLFRRPDDEMSSTTTTDPATSSNETETEGELETETETERDAESRESTPVNQFVGNAGAEAGASASSSLSSLLSAATPTPTAEQPTRAEDTFVSFGSIREQAPEASGGSIGAASALSATREEFVRNMEKVRELIEMTRREQEHEETRDGVVSAPTAPEQSGMPRSPSPPPIPPPPAGLQHYNPTTSPDHPHTVSSGALAPLLLSRQESAESHCSDSTQHSQCTAINLASPPPSFASSSPPPQPQTQPQKQPQPPTPPLRQQQYHAPKYPVPLSAPAPAPAFTCTHPEPPTEQQQQQESEISVADDEPEPESESESDPIKKLRLLCTETLASMPYGEQVLEELASVAQDIAEPGAQPHNSTTMPYPLPEMPHIRELQLSTKHENKSSSSSSFSSSAWLGMPTQADPKLLVCLSPAQRPLVGETKPDQLLDDHQKFVERRGYHELSSAQVRALDSEQEQQQQQKQSEMLKTAAMMRELRKSLTPTPPPVPVKSAETAAKASAKRDDASDPKKNAASVGASSSIENKPRRAADPIEQQSTEQQEQQEQHQQQQTRSSHQMNSSTDFRFPATSMGGMESELARMFPSMAQQQGDIFEEQRKRFSNIETSNSQQPRAQQSKRYSNIETSSYESKKRTENGQVIYDITNSSHEKQSNRFPVAETEARSGSPDHAPPPPVPPPPIMSATKLNGSTTANTFIEDDDAPKNSRQEPDRRENGARNRESGTASTSTFGGTYEEFRQRAKAAVDAIGGPRPPPPAPANGLDNEKVFKDFDRLSQQMNAELQSTRERREKSASLFDLSGMTRSQGKHPLEELKQRRHAHMQELEREIERSSRSRQERMSSVPRNMESTPTSRTYEIPIELELEQGQEQRSRRAESMCNLSEPRPRPHTSVGHYNYSNNNSSLSQDDWARYASDLGYSENIARPFAREVEICYQRQGQNPTPRQSQPIRAPRLSASTNDLSSSGHQHSFDSHNAYGGRRTHAPMLSQAPQQQRPHYASCYSMIERDPNPKYISTTSRRGVSPGPAPSPVIGVPPPAYDRQQRRSSLPRELHEQQLKYILSKEEELRLEVERLQLERRRLMEEMQRAPILPPPQRRESYRPAAKLPTLSEDEVFRQQMAEEWMNKVAEREERRQHKIIKISKIEDEQDHATERANISDEFLSAVKERRHKLAMPADSDWESGAESQPQANPQVGVAANESSSDVEAAPVRILEGQAEASLRQLPRHLREFAKFSTSEQMPDGAQVERHEQQERREEATDHSHSSASQKTSIVKTYKVSRLPPSVQDRGATATATATATAATGTETGPAMSVRLRPRPPKQTRFLLNPQQLQRQRQRRSWSESDLLKEIDSELQLAKGFLYANVYKVKHEYMSEPETDHDRPRKMAQLGRRQYDGIGPVTNDGMPIILRSEVQEPHQHEWYKRLYQTIHKQKNGDDFVIRYKCPRARPSYKSNGYVSEPEPNYDSDYSTVRYRTQNPHRVQSVSSAVNVRNLSQDEKLYGTMPNPIKSAQNSYKNQPGRIEDYTTGHSSVSEKEKKEWWDEVMDIFNGNLEQSKLSPLYTEGNLSRALAKESGYTSDSNLVFRKKELPVSSPLSPVEQRQAYKSLQAGGEPPLFGFRKPAPERPRDPDSNAPPIPPQPPIKGLYSSTYDLPYSTDTIDGSDVNIHFKTPIRHEQKQHIPEEELATRQAEHMQKLYHEERRRKYLQELQDMNSRRHTDNFTPSQKSPIALNRYDDFPTDVTLKSLVGPKTVARALYNFQGQSSKELSFRKGDTIYIRRQIDPNWYEGEHNAMIGLLPASYVEIVSRDGARTPSKRPSEGQARAKYNFQAQSGVELSLNKGELVTLTRRVDGNWFEGKIANRKGIFPVSYVEVLTDIGAEDIAARTTTVISSQSTTNLRPNLDVLRTNINNEFNTLTQNGAQPVNGILKETRTLHKTDALHVDTSSEPLAYRALYKYRPQNSDELELLEGDLVHVLEKCDDGWFVGTSQRTGCFGTFPGNYVERA